MPFFPKCCSAATATALVEFSQKITWPLSSSVVLSVGKKAAGAKLHAKALLFPAIFLLIVTPSSLPPPLLPYSWYDHHKRFFPFWCFFAGWPSDDKDNACSQSFLGCCSRWKCVNQAKLLFPASPKKWIHLHSTSLREKRENCHCDQNTTATCWCCCVKECCIIWTSNKWYPVGCYYTHNLMSLTTQQEQETPPSKTGERKIGGKQRLVLSHLSSNYYYSLAFFFWSGPKIKRYELL